MLKNRAATFQAPKSTSKAIADEPIGTRTSNPVRNGGGINNKPILITNPIGEIPRKAPFEFNPSLAGTGPLLHNPARESPAPELREDGKVTAISPHGAVGKWVAAGRRVTGGSVAAGHDELLAGGFTEGGIVTIIKGEDVVIGDGEEGVG